MQHTKKPCLVGRGRHYGTRWRWWQGKWCWTWLQRLQQPTSSYNQQHTSVKDTNNSTAVKPSGRFIFLFEAGATVCYDCTVVCLIIQTAVIEPTGRTFKVQHVKATVIQSYFLLLHLWKATSVICNVTNLQLITSDFWSFFILFYFFYSKQKELFTLHRKKKQVKMV